MANENTAKVQTPEAPKATAIEAPKPDKPAITLTSVLAERTKLIGMIKAIESKSNPDDIERFAVEKMREKLAGIDGQFGTLANLEITRQFFDLGSKLLIEGIVTEAGKFVVTLAPGEPVDVRTLGAKQSAKVDGEKGIKRKYGWNVDGKTEDTGATLVVRAVGDAVTLVRGEFKPADVLGICARKGWKVQSKLGPIVNKQQGKVVSNPDGSKSHVPYPIEGTTITPKAVSTGLGAHKHALLAVAKDRESEAVKWAIGFLRDLIGDEGVADSAFKLKKASAADLIKYMASLHAMQEKAHAPTIG